ncbi:MAG: tRNA (adenosine(37)-N6)-threonylcarbamoyltransferase complex dimerization subunit type 1 TsaB [Eubacteriales bacterium]|nr:tRNA (adenosine(37)-N6)-threonylcarbamoyltransferase complex dimerization subunit type 1 TsaB [Eubacteriales bacterium]
MFLLVFDTTGPVGSAALIDEEGRVTVRETREPMAHLKMLMPLTAELLRDRGIRPDDLTAVSAAAGPGSYTGIRIGVSTARALSQALSIPCVKVPTLEMFRAFSGNGRAAAVILNARRGQVYGAVFGADGETVLTPGPWMLEDAVNAADPLGGCVTWYGDGIDAYKDSPKYGGLLEGRIFAPESVRYQNAGLAAPYALREYQEGKTLTYDELLPEYMRKTEAEQKWKDGTLAEARKRKLQRIMGISGDAASDAGKGKR